MPDRYADYTSPYGYKSPYWDQYAGTVAKQLPNAGRPRAKTPGPSTKRNIGNPGAPHISQIGAETLAAQVNLADTQARRYLKELLTRKALNTQTELQALVAARYKGGTGRLGRGIRVNVSVREMEQGLMGTMSLSIPRYRETPYVTNLGNQGIFHKLGGGGVPPYMIAAKGAIKLLTSRSSRRTSMLSIEASDTYLKGSRRRQERMVPDPVKGGKSISYRQIEKRMVSYAKRYKKADFVPRLKIPRGGYTTGIRKGGIFTLLQDLDFEERAALSVNRRRTKEFAIGRGGRRGDIPGITRAEAAKGDVAYRYPIFVIHPGFPMGDVISNYWQGTIMSVMNEMPQMTAYYTEAVNRGGKTIGVLQPPSTQVELVNDTQAWLRSLSPAARAPYRPISSSIPMSDPGSWTADSTQIPYRRRP